MYDIDTLQGDTGARGYPGESGPAGEAVSVVSHTLFCLSVCLSVCFCAYLCVCVCVQVTKPARPKGTLTKYYAGIQKNWLTRYILY